MRRNLDADFPIEYSSVQNRKIRRLRSRFVWPQFVSCPSAIPVNQLPDGARRVALSPPPPPATPRHRDMLPLYLLFLGLPALVGFLSDKPVNISFFSQIYTLGVVERKALDAAPDDFAQWWAFQALSTVRSLTSQRYPGSMSLEGLHSPSPGTPSPRLTRPNRSATCCCFSISLGLPWLFSFSSP